MKGDQSRQTKESKVKELRRARREEKKKKKKKNRSEEELVPAEFLKAVPRIGGVRAQRSVIGS